MARAFIGIGSNMGDRQAHVRLAVERLSTLSSTALVAMSPVYETDPVGPVGQSKFLNAAAELRTLLLPGELLSCLQRIETEAGRPAREDRVYWGPRTLDLDLLLYEDVVITTPELVLPHPRMHERWFVLKPLTDLDPSLQHPILEMTVMEMLQQLELQRHAEPQR